jgi:DNA-binding beta-propeller fold protein YncE
VDTTTSRRKIATCFRMPTFVGTGTASLEQLPFSAVTKRSRHGHEPLMKGCYSWNMRGLRGRIALVAAVPLVGVLAFVAVSRSVPAVGNSGRSPAQLTAHSPGMRHYEYVVASGAIYVYSIDRRNRLVQTISLPVVGNALHGMVFSPRKGTLYISFGRQAPPGGELLAYDLRHSRILWRRTYKFGIDSMAISQNGRWIYMPAGEKTTDGKWRIIAASNGRPTGAAIVGPSGAHNTILGPSARYLYLGGVHYPYLEVASTASNRVIRKLGPLNGPGVRPFTINGSETLAFTTARSFLGFQVSSITTGQVLYTVPVPGFSFNPATFRRTPDHGISLSPDERRLYLIDTPNGYVHVFDVAGLPASPPRLIASIKLKHAPPNDGWLQTSRDGHYLYVGRSGDVIDTRRLKIVDYLPPLQRTADFLEIDWRRGRPVSTTNRYGIGYERRPPG